MTIKSRGINVEHVASLKSFNAKRPLLFDDLEVGLFLRLLLTRGLLMLGSQLRQIHVATEPHPSLRSRRWFAKFNFSRAIKWFLIKLLLLKFTVATAQTVPDTVNVPDAGSLRQEIERNPPP